MGWYGMGWGGGVEGWECLCILPTLGCRCQPSLSSQRSLLLVFRVKDR